MWDYSSFNRKSLTKIVSKQSLSLGTLIHKTLEKWLLDSNSDVVDHFMNSAIAELDNIKKKYKQQVGTGISDVELAPYLDAVSLGRAMIINYKDFWKGPLPKGFHIVSPEQKINIEVAPDLVIEGKLDGLIANDRGTIFILEHKTYGQRPRIDNLNVNDQFLCYIWIAQRLNIGRIGGIAYDGMWKREKPPRGSTMEDLFIRTELVRTQAEINQFGEYLIQEMLDMKRVHEEAETNKYILYPSHRWEGCFDCDFIPLCNAQSNDEDMDFVTRHMYTLREKDEDSEME